MKLKNHEIKKMVDILTAEDGLIHNTKIKLPHAFRHVLRVNFKTLSERNDIYTEGIRECINRYIELGQAKQDENGTISFDQNVIPEVNKELTELAMVDNDITLEHIDKEILDRVLENIDMSMEEEDILVTIFSE